MQRLAIITTHPIQYYAPLFRMLTERKKIEVKIFYTWGDKGMGEVYDPGFGKTRTWDIPLLEGYNYEFVPNISRRPGSDHFWGINNPTLINRIKDWQANALLVFGWNFKSHLQAMMHFKGSILVLFRGDSTLLDEKKGFSIKKMLRRFSLKFIYRFIDYALYVGKNNRIYFLAHGVPSSKLVYAPHAIDNVRFADVDGSKENEALQWKKELGILPAKLTVLFAGKLEPKKNPFIIIEAAKALPRVHFIIAGNGVLEKELIEQSRQLKNITFLPFQNQSRMPVLYRLADIFVLPSVGPGETWGLAINEAMASGRVVIATNKCGGAVDLIKENGFIISPDIKSLYNVLNHVKEHQDKLPYMKIASPLSVDNFTLDILADSIEKIFITSNV